MKRLALVALLALGSCATVDFEAQDNTACTSPKTPPGSEGYVSCRTALADQRAASARLANQRLMSLAAGMSQMGQAAPVRSMQASQPIRTTCFKRSEYTSGFNKVCNYDCLGSAYAETVSAASLCPLTVSR